MLPESKLVLSQSKTFVREWREDDDTRYIMDLRIRYDDDCRNGHNTFSITSWVKRRNKFGNWQDHGGGSNHDEIARIFPEYKRYIKWHLCSSDGPMHYVANSLWHAGDKDCWGKRKGEEKSWDHVLYFGTSPIGVRKYNKRFIAFALENKNLEIIEVPHGKRPGDNYDYGSKWTFKGLDEEPVWYKCPFDSLLEATEMKEAIEKCPMRVEKVCVAWGEGKEPDLEAARSCAIWPDAKLEDFTKEKLEARLPMLLSDFRQDMLELGFEW